MDKFLDKISRINSILQNPDDQEIIKEAEFISNGIDEVEQHVIEMQTYIDQLILKSKNARSQAEFETIQSKIEEIKTDLPKLINQINQFYDITKKNAKWAQIKTLHDHIEGPVSKN